MGFPLLRFRVTSLKSLLAQPFDLGKFTCLKHSSVSVNAFESDLPKVIFSLQDLVTV